jgi:hypothetical protein
MRAARPGDRVYARMPDGTIRRAESTGQPDTLFSTPARVSWNGRNVEG